MLPLRRLTALCALAACADPAKQPVSHWVAQLRANDADDRAEAREWLVKKGKEAVPDLAKLLADDDTVVAMSAADVLSKIGKDAVPALVDALVSGPRPGRRWAASALGEIGRDAKDAVPALEAAALDPEIKSAAADALLKIAR
ncbi:MAG: HEAT repeat domain-containing protein [Planctomycetia bacterium]|nr:HEAT repeat domain-containing protein [Planctomycetia bacterium]